MAGDTASTALRDLLLTTKDGDWGKESPERGFVPYRVIRGTDFPGVRNGDTSSVPVRYLSEATVHRRTLEPDDILLETAGGSPGRPTGRSLLITERLLSSLDLPATCASFARFLRVDPSKAVPSYIYWHLQYLYACGQMEEHQVQHTGVARFQYTTFAETEQIALPSPEEQRVIANILGTLDDKIELNRRMNQGLDAMARALFKSWFVDFDPVRAKAEGSDPGLPKPLADLFPDSFEDSELGEIPKGWCPSSVYGLATYINGAAYRAFEPNEWRRGLPIIKIAELKAGVTAQTRFSAVDMPVKYKIDTGDILFSWSGNPDTSIDIFVWTHGPAWLNQHIFRVVPCSAQERAYVLMTLRTLRPVFAEIARNKQTTGLGHVTVEDLKRLLAVRPPESVLQGWNAIIEPVLARSFGLEEEKNTLATLRDTLLPKLISGELLVRDPSRIVEVSQ